jgi:hypothetical protein
MSKRNEIVILATLVVLLAAVADWEFRPGSDPGGESPADVAVQPLRVPNPSLHLAQLDQIRQLGYTGTHRNIFSATPLPPPPSAVAKGKEADASYLLSPAGPPLPPPLQVPLTFYGMAVDPKTGKRVAFFTNGDDVYVAAEGDTLLGRFRLVHIGTDSAIVEEVSTGRQATLPMTQPANGAAPPDHPGVPLP